MSFLCLIILYFWLNIIFAQKICYNQTTQCFDPKVSHILTFQYNQYTSCLNFFPILQMNCIDYNTNFDSGLCLKYSKLIHNIECHYNTIKAGNIDWICYGNLPKEVIFHSTIVSCENCRS